MRVAKAKNALKIGDFVLKNNHRNKIAVIYSDKLAHSILTDDRARIYLIVVNRIIKKIGGSASKGGIKSTMSFYTSAMTGSPGAPRFIIHLLIYEALIMNHNVELYMITSPKVIAKVNGLYTTKDVEIASFKEMEDLCKSEYYKVMGRYPDWNYQENHEPYPKHLAQKHNEYHKNRLRT